MENYEIINRFVLLVMVRGVSTVREMVRSGLKELNVVIVRAWATYQLSTDIKC
jgi:hypothetical protein